MFSKGYFELESQLSALPAGDLAKAPDRLQSMEQAACSCSGFGEKKGCGSVKFISGQILHRLLNNLF